MKNIFCVTGFLGLQSSWDFLKSPQFHVLPHTPEDFIENQLGALFAKEKGDVLLGYSLGGRLSLKAMAEGTCQPKAAIIISANPGLTSPEERRKRLATDQEWANDFRVGPWNDLLLAWDKQRVFGGKPCRTDRPEKSYDREKLAWLLDGFSLGRQPDFRGKLKALDFPILFMAGSEDQKYAVLAKEMGGLNSRFQFWVAPGCAHRVPWELNEKVFVEKIEKFLEVLK